jgi:hypothetical protein
LLARARVAWLIANRFASAPTSEIETALDKAPSLKQNVVVAADIAGQKQLVAYVVAKPEYTQSLDIEGLQKHVERLCTPYMVPGIFIQLDALPLLPNGKVCAMLWGLLPRPLRPGLPCHLSCVCRSTAMRCRRPMQLGSRCANRPSKVRALRTE